jgi:hypothetical protein
MNAIYSGTKNINPTRRSQYGVLIYEDIKSDEQIITDEFSVSTGPARSSNRLLDAPTLPNRPL